jgi:hypothetical protein
MGKNRLNDILGGDDHDRLRDAWNSTQAASDFDPVPPGTYKLRLLKLEPFTSRQKGTPGVRWHLEVTGGQFAGRRVFHEPWLTAAALPMSKRDLGKIGITSLDQVDNPVPQGILVSAKVVLRKDDDGNERNRVVRLEFIGREAPDAYAPKDEAAVDDLDDEDDSIGGNAGEGVSQ